MGSWYISSSKWQSGADADRIRRIGRPLLQLLLELESDGKLDAVLAEIEARQRRSGTAAADDETLPEAA